LGELERNQNELVFIQKWCFSSQIQLIGFPLVIDSGLNPLPINLEDIEEDEKIETPIVKVPKGRPKSQRIKAPIEIGYSSQLSSQGIPKRPVKCSQCQQIGHNKATCKNLIASTSLGVPIDIGD
jgi:hypothetical protein